MQSAPSTNNHRFVRPAADRDDPEFLTAELVLRLTVLSETTTELLDAVKDESHARRAKIQKPGDARPSGLVTQLERIDRIGVRARALLLSDPPLKTTKLLTEFGHEATEAALLTLSLLGVAAPCWNRSWRPLDLASARARCFVELMHELSPDQTDRVHAKRLLALRDALAELGDCAAEISLIVSTD